MEPAVDDWEPIRQFLRDIRHDDEKIEAFCRRVGLPYIQTWELLNYRRVPSSKTAEKFRAALGNDLPRMPVENENLLTLVQAAEMLSVVPRTIWRLRRDGIIKLAVGEGKNLRFIRAEIEEIRDRQLSSKTDSAIEAESLHEPATPAALPKTCACRPECDAPVLTPGRTYARGHFPRTPGEIHQPKRPPKVSQCAACGESFTHPAGKSRTYCSKRCSGSVKLKSRTPKNAFEQFLYDQWQASGRSLRACSMHWGLGENGLRGLLNGDFPTETTLATLQAFFAALGLELPGPDPRGGFTSDTHRRRAQVTAHNSAEVPAWEYSRDPEVRAKTAAAGRTRRRAPASVEKWRETIQGDETGQAWRDGLADRKAWQTSMEYRAARSLHRWLKEWHRRGGVGAPPDELVNGHIQGLLARLQRDGTVITQAELDAITRPILAEYGLVPPIGRPHVDEAARCRIVADEYRLLPPSRRRRVDRSFWPRVAARVSEVEGGTVTAKTMKEWRISHDEWHLGCQLRGLVPGRPTKKRPKKSVRQSRPTFSVVSGLPPERN